MEITSALKHVAPDSQVILHITTGASILRQCDWTQIRDQVTHQEGFPLAGLIYKH